MIVPLTIFVTKNKAGVRVDRSQHYLIDESIASTAASCTRCRAGPPGRLRLSALHRSHKVRSTIELIYTTSRRSSMISRLPTKRSGKKHAQQVYARDRRSRRTAQTTITITPRKTQERCDDRDDRDRRRSSSLDSADDRIPQSARHRQLVFARITADVPLREQPAIPPPAITAIGHRISGGTFDHDRERPRGFLRRRRAARPGTSNR